MELATERAKLVKHLSQEVRSRRVIEAVAKVPREFFVLAEYHLTQQDSKVVLVDRQVLIIT